MHPLFVCVCALLHLTPGLCHTTAIPRHMTSMLCHPTPSSQLLCIARSNFGTRGAPLPPVRSAPLPQALRGLVRWSTLRGLHRLDSLILRVPAGTMRFGLDLLPPSGFAGIHQMLGHTEGAAGCPGNRCLLASLKRIQGTLPTLFPMLQR